MKNYMISLFLLSIPMCISAQMIDLQRGRTTKIEILQIHGNFKITGTNSDRILIERVKYNPIPESIREPLEGQGYKKSDSQDLSLQKVGSKLTISPANIKGQFADYELKVPADMMIKLTTDVKVLYKEPWNRGDVFSHIHNYILIENMKGEIVLSTYTSDIEFEEVTGPITCALYRGQIDASFSKLLPETKSAISVFDGDVNLYLSKKANCSVELSVGYGQNQDGEYEPGNINSDFDIKNVEFDTPDNLWMNKIEKGKAINKLPLKNPSIKGQINEGGSSSFDISVYSGEINILEKSW